jgi:hypothetical protein
MPYDSDTGLYERRSTTVIDASPDGDSVYIAIDAKLDLAADDTVTDLNHHAANGNHYPATSTHTDSRFLRQSPSGTVSWANGVVAADAALKDFSNVASGAIAPAKVAQDASNRFMTDTERTKLEGIQALAQVNADITKAEIEAKLTGAISTHAHMGRNKIINGNFNINQRAYVSGTNTTGANQYTLDRWRVVTSGQNITFVADGNGFTVTAPAGGIEQVIEGINIEGGTYVLNWTGTATAAVNGTARAKGESFTLTANTNATVKFSSGTVGLVQLEAGSVATPFEHRNISTETALCRRYYEIALIALDCNTSTASPFSCFTFNYRTQKRAAPTVAQFIESAPAGVVFNSIPKNTADMVAVVYTNSATAGLLYGSVSSTIEL